jgi:uncharacterized protein
MGCSPFKFKQMGLLEGRLRLSISRLFVAGQERNIMTPEERQLLAGLFDRIRTASNSQRDAQAEAFIAENIKSLPSAPYLLAQAVIVQEQALAAANQRLQELEAKVQSAESQSSGSFLGGLGKSLFGSSGAPQPAPQPAPATRPPPAAPGSPSGPWGQTQQAGGGPWGGGGPIGGGSSFLSGALTTAAGVAGGMLLAESVRNLFTGGRNPGMANIAGPGLFGGGSAGQGETIVNNYYSDPAGLQAQDTLQDMDQDQDDAQDAQDAQIASDDGSDFGSSNDDGSFDV